MRYFTLGSMMAMVALSFSLAQPAQAYLFGFSNEKNPIVLTLNGVPLTNDDSGWYRDVVSPIHISGYQNYIVAQPGDVDAAAYRNYFVFDISDLSPENPLDSPDLVTSASLTLFSYDVTSIETYRLFDVTTPIHDLIDGPFALSAFNDLGSGEVYGSRLYNSGEDNEFHPITIDSPAFFANLNAAITAGEDRFAIGGAVDTSGPVGGGIVVTPGLVPKPAGNVPEPSTLLLLGAALVGLAAWRRKHAA